MAKIPARKITAGIEMVAQIMIIRILPWVMEMTGIGIPAMMARPKTVSETGEAGSTMTMAGMLLRAATGITGIIPTMVDIPLRGDICHMMTV